MNEIITWIISHGVTEELLTVLLLIPVFATIINFSRYILGLKMFSIYAPMVLGFAYIYSGIRFGLLITFAVITATLISYQILKKIRMHYISRVAINYIFITIAVILAITINDISPIQLTTTRHDVTTVHPLSVILITTLSYFFIKQQVKKNFTTTLRSLIETVIIGMVGWSLMRYKRFPEFLINNLWYLPVLIGINLLIGVYTGKRFKELFRFKKLMKDAPKEKE